LEFLFIEVPSIKAIFLPNTNRTVADDEFFGRGTSRASNVLEQAVGRGRPREALLVGARKMTGTEEAAFGANLRHRKRGLSQ
jgi:hypothetical protein